MKITAIKKVLFISAVFLLSAGCNKRVQNTQSQPQTNLGQPVIKVGGATATSSNSDLQLNFKITKTVISPFDGTKLLLAVNSYDSISNQYLNSDSSCGGIETFSDCYIFWNGAAPKKLDQTLIMVFRVSQVGLIKKDSIKFINDHTISFESGDGDAGYSYTAQWQFNLWTEELKQISKQSN